jgi:hypothetical protein
MHVISPEVLISLISYDAQSGAFSWQRRNRDLFTCDRMWAAWNARHAGKRALNAPHSSGYLHGRVLDKVVYAHRAAWVFHHGRWPSGVIDHADGNVTNNAIANLRDVSHAENIRNCRLSKNNTSGINGVWWDKSRRAWIAEAVHDGIKYNAGKFSSIDDAAEARRALSAALGFHANHGASR